MDVKILGSVSYTHLDVYKRQPLNRIIWLDTDDHRVGQMHGYDQTRSHSLFHYPRIFTSIVSSVNFKFKDLKYDFSK